MLEQLKQVEEDGLKALESVQDEAALEAWRVAHLGRSSGLMQVFGRFGQLSKEEKPVIGQRANEVKKALESAFSAKAEEMRQAALKRSLEQEQLDVTLPGRRLPLGRLHPDTQTMRELYRVFGEMGFQVFRSREVETSGVGMLVQALLQLSFRSSVRVLARREGRLPTQAAHTT